jgi:hypothetical protein
MRETVIESDGSPESNLKIESELIVEGALAKPQSQFEMAGSTEKRRSFHARR